MRSQWYAFTFTLLYFYRPPSILLYLQLSLSASALVPSQAPLVRGLPRGLQSGPSCPVHLSLSRAGPRMYGRRGRSYKPRLNCSRKPNWTSSNSMHNLCARTGPGLWSWATTHSPCQLQQQAVRPSAAGSQPPENLPANCARFQRLHPGSCQEPKQQHSSCRVTGSWGQQSTTQGLHRYLSPLAVVEQGVQVSCA